MALLKNGAFKEEFAHFLMEEWKKPPYGPIIDRKTVYISHGGKCMEMENSEDEMLQTLEPSRLQGQHKEADTLIAFHGKNITTGNILARSTDTDVLIILLGLVGSMEGLSIMMDYGSGNQWRYIYVSEIAAILEEKHSGLTEALLGLHAIKVVILHSA
ncbi:hypothetical protein Hamer_G001944 [Homarus americanus]|uniref:Uncharacterized protein n=1 Tax=Homarus americanus TaxID=6706 RepID=A0A8J5JUY5_HOMAM|nr:hypothetical protein Hamer_G001944 [Homarus americanus]